MLSVFVHSCTRAADTPRPWGDKATTGLFAVALLIACLIHLVLILGVGFPFPKAGPDRQATRPLELIVLHRAGTSSEMPEIADAEPTREEESPPTPVSPSLPEPTGPGPAAMEQPVASVFSARPEPGWELQSRSILEPQPLPNPLPPESGPARVDAAEILASRDLALAELTARMQHDSATSANRPRRKAISAGTREYSYANYLEAWRRKVEQVGNLNYPEEAKRLKIYGNLLLHIAIRADGSVEQVRVLRSSGFDLLDEAAVEIIELAAPFSPFPPDIRAEADVLDITRTWRFLSNNRLGWER